MPFIFYFISVIILKMIVDISEEDRVVVRLPRASLNGQNRNNQYTSEYEYYDGYGEIPNEEEKQQRSA